MVRYPVMAAVTVSLSARLECSRPMIYGNALASSSREKASIALSTISAPGCFKYFSSMGV
ncbi:MAG: hypothetical protein ACD_47C00151G0003 [uncultured bacterium]|nr:MAG: hypothetical protein ACD_47C00151G0003 [uncultured bacterium]